MKIAVCMRRVPDTAAKIKIADDGRSIDTSGIEYAINPYEEYAIEEAVRVKEKFGGEVTVITLGPEESTSIITKALSLGCDRAVLLKSPVMPQDPAVTSAALAEELRAREFDLVFFGKKAVDDDSQQVGVMVAELLGLPCVSSVVKLEISDGRAVLHREVEGGIEIIESSMPIVLTAEKGLNEPRYASLRDLMLAKKKPVEVKTIALGESKAEVIELSYPPSKPPGKIVGHGVEAVPTLVKLLREEAKVI